MQKIILILLFLFRIGLYSQESEYSLIAESDIKIQYEKIIDTLHDKRLSKLWNTIKSDSYKEKIRKKIIAQKRDIESDTSNFTKIYYIGKKENISLKINDKLLNPTSSNSQYHSESIYGDSIFKIYIGTISRYYSIIPAELIFNDLKRKAKIQLDTKYSLIEIKVKNIVSLLEISKRKESEEDQSLQILNASDKLPVIPCSIEILKNEEVSIWHLISKIKYN